jgi:hypothetical protein
MSDQPIEVVEATAAGIHTHPHEHPHEHPEIIAEITGMRAQYDAWETARAAQESAARAETAATVGLVAAVESEAAAEEAASDAAVSDAALSAVIAESEAEAEPVIDEEVIAEEAPPESDGPVSMPREKKSRGWWDNYSKKS